MNDKLQLNNLKKIVVILLGIFVFVGLTACQKQQDYSVDEQCINNILGEYQVVSEEDDGDEYVGSWWHLSIRCYNEDEYELAIYDNEAGNPGIEGTVVSVDDSNIVIEYDSDYYDELPSAKWKVDGKYFSVNYELTDDGIKLTNGDKTLSFTKELETLTYAGHWKSPDSDEIQSIEITDTELKLNGWICDPTEGWVEREYSFQLAEECDYNECVVAGMYVEKEEFLKTLNSEDSKCTVFEVDVKGDEVIEIRLIGSDESSLAE